MIKSKISNILLIVVILSNTYANCIELPVVVIIPAFNVKQWSIQCLGSIFSQNYSNYRIIYIDDNSTDQNQNIVKAYIKSKNQTQRTTLIENKIRRRPLANTYKAIHMCHDDEIVVILDGDDWFKHNNCLSTINKFYQKHDVWMTCGNFEWLRFDGNGTKEHQSYATKYPDYVIKNNLFRHYEWLAVPTRTFKSWLFKEIKLVDFLDKNYEFYKTAGDVSYMLPMLEMAGEKYDYIKDVSYVYNMTNPLSDFWQIKKQQSAEQEIRSKEKYLKITEKPSIKTNYKICLICQVAQNDLQQETQAIKKIAETKNLIDSIIFIGLQDNQIPSCLKKFNNFTVSSLTQLQDLLSQYDYCIHGNFNKININKNLIDKNISALVKTKARSSILFKENSDIEINNISDTLSVCKPIKFSSNSETRLTPTQEWLNDYVNKEISTNCDIIIG